MHGYNNSQIRAQDIWVETHKLLVDRQPILLPEHLDGLTHYFWPGDVKVGRAVGAFYFSSKISAAMSCAEYLATFLSRHAEQLNRNHGVRLWLSFIAHSLGCRLVLEALRRVSNDTNIVIENVLLMAAAVPEGLCDTGQPFGPGRGADRAAVLWSRADDVLGWKFRTGQWWARKRYNEVDPGTRPGAAEAVGHTGGPNARWRALPEAGELEAGHGDYWTKPDCVTYIKAVFNAEVQPRFAPRMMPVRQLELWPPVERNVASWTAG